MGNLIGWHSLKSTLGTDSYELDVVWYGGATSASDAVLPAANELNLALVNLTGTNYRALSVVREASPGAAASTMLKLKRIRIAASGDGYCLFVNDSGGSTTPDRAIVLEGAHLAVNSDHDLILVNSGLSLASAEATAWVSFGDRGLRAVLISGKWYLVVCE